MSEEAFSALLVGLFGICSSDAFSWDHQSLLPPFLDVNPTCCQISYLHNTPLSELDQVALDSTLWSQEVTVTGGTQRGSCFCSSLHSLDLSSSQRHQGIGSSQHCPGIGSSPSSQSIGSSQRRPCIDRLQRRPGIGSSPRCPCISSLQRRPGIGCSQRRPGISSLYAFCRPVGGSVDAAFSSLFVVVTEEYSINAFLFSPATASLIPRGLVISSSWTTHCKFRTLAGQISWYLSSSLCKRWSTNDEVLVSWDWKVAYAIQKSFQELLWKL